jgi:chemotaxis protein MotB
VFDDGGSMIQRAERTRGSLIPREPVLAQSDTVQARKDFANNDSATKGLVQPAPLRRYESLNDLRELSMLVTHLAEDAGLRSNLQTIITPYGLRVMLHDTDRIGMFERGNAFPSDRFRRLLRSLGPVFAKAENQLLVVGHTDSTPFVNADENAAGMSNWSLSSHRATAARFHMMAGGLPSTNILQVVGMADRSPIDPARPDAGVNRRIELLVLTQEHAQAIAEMFGPTSASALLAPGMDASLPERGALQSIRERLTAP